MKCPICGKSFYVKEARKEFENYFNNELKYDDSFEVRMCSDCAIKKMEEIKARVSQESEDDAKEFFESFADSTEEDSERMVSILDSIYETVVDGIPHVSQSVEDLASDYLLKNDDTGGEKVWIFSILSSLHIMKRRILSRLLKTGTQLSRNMTAAVLHVL